MVLYLKCCCRKSSELLSEIDLLNLFDLDINHFIKWSMLYYVIIIEHIDSNILFILDDNFNKKFNVCHYKCIFWHSFQQGKA
jgi:hypothetical protein